MNEVNWTQVVVFGVVALLILLLALSFLPLGWGGGWGPGGMMGQMMGPGMMGGWGGTMGGSWGVLGWLFPLIGLLIAVGFLVLLALGGVWLFRQVNAPQGPATGRTQTATGETCPSCGRAVQADWQVCPYCGQGLV